MKQNKMLQSGRSMVEMLGTLAIIGVLSIGGIAGYSYGMDKYRANQTINDIMLRAVDLMTQASQGRDALSLDEWINEPSVYDFSNPTYSDDDLGLIMFDVGANNKIPQRVCEMVYDGLSNSVIQIDVNEQVSNSKNDCASDNTMTFYFEGGNVNENGELICEPACGEGEQCENGHCFKVDKPIYSYVDSGECSHGWSCNGGAGICEWGKCIAKECSPTIACSDKSKYCASSNKSCSEAFPSGELGTCIKPDFTLHKINGKSYYISNTYISWWNADAACRFLGRDGLVDIDDVVTGWTGESGSFNYTELGLALKELLIHPRIWVSNNYNNCHSYNVGMDYEKGEVSVYRERNHFGEHTAVCK